MPGFPTFNELYDLAKAEAQARDPRLRDWNEGSALDALIGSGALQADEVLRWAAARLAELSLDTATGSALDALALDRYPDLLRKPAAAARGALVWTRAVATADRFVAAGTRVRAQTDAGTVEAVVEADAIWPAGEAQLVTAARVSVSGPAGNLPAGSFDEVLDAIPGEPDATVGHAERFVGGADEEGDEAFRARIKGFLRALRRGTVDALRVAALSVPGVAAATVSEAYIAPEAGGYVAVYVGDVDGRGNAELAQLVAAEIEGWRAAGVAVVVTAAAREEIPVSLLVRVRAGADRAGVAAAVRAAVLAAVGRLQPGESLYPSILAAAAHLDPRVASVEVEAPSGPVAPTQPQNAIRVTDAGLSVPVTG